MIDTIQSLRQHQLVMLRRLRMRPLTEFELVAEVVDHSGYTEEQASGHMPVWLDELRDAGLIWSGTLHNGDGQQMMAAALTRAGADLVA